MLARNSSGNGSPSIRIRPEIVIGGTNVSTRPSTSAAFTSTGTVAIRGIGGGAPDSGRPLKGNCPRTKYEPDGISRSSKVPSAGLYAEPENDNPMLSTESRGAMEIDTGRAGNDPDVSATRPRIR